MSELRFHLGDNIHETAQRSGIPRFTVDKTGGLVAYYANVEIPAEIGLRYDRPSFEVVFRPLSQLDLWAEKRNPSLAVHSATVFLSKIPTGHEPGRFYIRTVIDQFQRGRWRRYIPARCPRVTGRSTALDAQGRLAITGCPLDPDWDIDPELWREMLASHNQAIWSWIGDGVIATLTVSAEQLSGTIHYFANVEFETESSKRYFEEKNARFEQAKVDDIRKRQGLPPITQRERDVERDTQLAELRAREKAAVERGDRVLPPEVQP